MKLNTNSNTYTIVYASVMVIVVAFLLAFMESALKPIQEVNIDNDKRGQILAALGLREVKEVEKTYNATIVQTPVVNVKGELISSDGAFTVDSKDITAKQVADKKLPLYVAKVNGETLYVVPLFGRGLWGGISGYLALKQDFTTVHGAYFSHESETAGLGARIVEEEIQNQFKGKKSFANSDFSEVLLGMRKERKYPDSEVDIITGATLTCNGMDKMFKECLAPYQAYFKANLK